MFDIKAGDTVVALVTDWGLIEGRSYICAAVQIAAACSDYGDDCGFGLKLIGIPDFGTSFCPHCEVQKAPRRDLSAWLKTSVPNTDHLDKPLPAKKRERVE